MKKEVFLAIFAGVAAGLVLAFGVWRLTINFKNNQGDQTSTTNSNGQAPIPTSGANFSIAVSSPDNLDVVTSSPVTISGLTATESFVVVSTDKNDYKVKSLKNGSFEVEISLSGGYNNIVITSFDKDGQSAKTTLELIYSSEFAKYQNQEETDNQASGSADTIRQKVQQKLDATLNKPVAYLGSITDINQESIQIKSGENGIQQVSISDDTSYSKSEDLAIGDFIIAMGFVDGNKVLEAKRILTDDPPTPNSNQAYWATITDISGKDVSFKYPESKEEIEITFPKTWVGPDIKDLEENKNYILTGSIVEKSLSLRTIFEITDENR